MIALRVPRAALAVALLVVAPAAVRAAPTAPRLSATPARLSFGQVPVGRTGTRSLTLLNPGVDPVLVRVPHLTGPGFDLPAPPVTGSVLPLNGGDSLAVPVRFGPVSAGAARGQLAVPSDSDTLWIDLDGQGTRVVIAEVLADPPTGAAGDANGDGTRHSYEDEFVELWNAGPDSVDLQRWRVGDDDTPPASWFCFAAGASLAPDARAVLFGGGAPRGIPGLIRVDDGRLGDGLANGGDTVVLIDADGDTSDWVTGETWGDNQSLSRDAAHLSLTPHRHAPGRDRAFSPGLPRIVLDSLTVHPASLVLTRGESVALLALGHWSDGDIDTLATAWSSSNPIAVGVDPAGRVTAADSGSAVVTSRWRGMIDGICDVMARLPHIEARSCRVVIDEVLADPPAGDGGDTNGDGLRHGFEDEFVELYNTGPDTAALGGWELRDDDVSPGRGFRFPAGTLLAPGERLTLFGGGSPAPELGPAFADDGRIGNGLTNSGDRLVLVDAAGDTVDAVDAAPWPADQSLVRWPAIQVAAPGSPVPPRPDPGAFAPHREPPGDGTPFSPGRERLLAPSPTNRAPDLVLPDSIRVFCGRRRRVPLEATDPDRDPLTVTVREGPPWVSAAEGVLMAQPPASASPRRAPLQVAVSDGASSCLVSTWVVSMAWPKVSITEILADPPAGDEGDANGDGQRHGYEDEFVEVLNRGPDLNLSGWSLSDDDTSPRRRFHFPHGTVLGQGERLVLFGGGDPKGLPGPVFADDGRLGGGLGNASDRLLLISDDPPDTVLDISYETPIRDQSLVFDQGGRITAHRALPGWTSFSPGAARPVLNGYRVDALEVLSGDEATPALWGLAPDTVVALDAGAALWLSLDPGIAEVSARAAFRGRRPGQTSVAAWIGGRVVALATVLVRPRPRPPNAPPRFTAAPDTQCLAGGNYHFAATAEDPEGSLLSYCPVQLPPWLDLDRVSGRLSGRVPERANQSWEVSLQVTDGHGGLAVLSYALHSVAPPRLRVAEVLADPPPGAAGDANGDGERHSYEDEFVELVNEGPDPVELAGLELRDSNTRESGAFLFPAGAVLLPGARTAVFGGGRSPPGMYSATGRLGDGLGNKRDAVFLIAPDGPDTVASASWELARDPDQSLCWDDGPPEGHGNWPYRDLYSPGRSRPVLRSLRIAPVKVNVPAGYEDTVRVALLYSDGRTVSFVAAPSAGWPRLQGSSSDVGVATVGIIDAPSSGSALAKGALGIRALAPGRARVAVRLDSFVASVPVEVRVPLAERVVFSPGWTAQAVPASRPLTFAAVLTGPAHVVYQWRANGELRESSAAQMRWTRSGGRALADTVRVTVSERRAAAYRPESLVRSWVLRGNTPPILLPLADTVAYVGQPFRTRLAISDADGDRAAFFLTEGPPGMLLSALDGDLTWTPALADTGRVTLQVRLHDGLTAGEYTAHLHVGVAPGRPAAASPILQVWPNPFASWEELQWELAAPCQEPELRVYSVLGQLLARVPVSPKGKAGGLAPALARRGVVTSGVYLTALWCDRPVAATRLLLLR